MEQKKERERKYKNYMEDKRGELGSKERRERAEKKLLSNHF